MHTHDEFFFLLDHAKAQLGLSAYRHSCTFFGKLNNATILQVSRIVEEDPWSIDLGISDDALSLDTQELWSSILHELIHVLHWPITKLTLPKYEYSKHQREVLESRMRVADEEVTYRMERILATHLPCPNLSPSTSVSTE